jgi:ribosomal protein S18 acetylase RimI-like enzyme
MAKKFKGQSSGETTMETTVCHSIQDGEERALFDFAENLPERGSWGKKTRFLHIGYRGFLRFFRYFRAFQTKCSLISRENGKIVGFEVAVYNSRWISGLSKRYQCKIEKRAHILGIAFKEERKDILDDLVKTLATYFSTKGIKSMEYPSFGNVCLTTATDVLTPENVDALVMFREVGFRISDCYYSMRLNLETHPAKHEHQRKRMHFHAGLRSLEIVSQNQALGKITWEPIQHGRTSIGVSVKLAHRRKGLGTALLSEALHHLKDKGVKSVDSEWTETM